VSGRRTPLEAMSALERVARAMACLAWMVRNKGRRLERAFRESTQRRSPDDAYDPGELAFKPPFWTFDERLDREARARRDGDA
jgi:hypothetical protein